MRQAIRPGRSLRLGLTLALVLGARGASAQYAPGLPFPNYTQPYQSFAYPIVPNNIALPNQGRFTNGLDPFVSGGSGGYTPYTFDRGFSGPAGEGRGPGDIRGMTGGRYMQYNEAFRSYDQDFNRVYIPNRKADERYLEERGRREDLYLQALATQDPAERARLRQELDALNSQTRGTLGYSSARRRPDATGASDRGNTAPFAPASADALRQNRERESRPSGAPGLNPVPGVRELAAPGLTPGRPSSLRPSGAPDPSAPVAPRATEPPPADTPFPYGVGPNDPRRREPPSAGPSERRR